MATFFSNSLTSNVMTDLFPTIGSTVSVSNVPTWMSSMKIFKVNEYTSEAGHRYMKGLRFSDNLAIAFTFSFRNSWTYLNEIEVYRFSGNNIDLIDQRKYDKQFFNEEFVREEVKAIVTESVESSLLLNGQEGNKQAIDLQINDLVEGTYRPLKEYDKKHLYICVKKALSSGE